MVFLQSERGSGEPKNRTQSKFWSGLQRKKGKKCYIFWLMWFHKEPILLTFPELNQTNSSFRSKANTKLKSLGLDPHPRWQASHFVCSIAVMDTNWPNCPNWLLAKTNHINKTNGKFPFSQVYEIYYFVQNFSVALGIVLDVDSFMFLTNLIFGQIWAHRMEFLED